MLFEIKNKLLMQLNVFRFKSLGIFFFYNFSCVMIIYVKNEGIG